jgi:CheY-like chemotaxis protein
VVGRCYRQAARLQRKQRPNLVSPATANGPRESSRQPSLRARGSRWVLVVEDNLDSVHSLVLLLRDMGHLVEYAINGYAAIAAAQKFKPEVVFLDLGLPGMDGFEVCRRLKREPGLEAARIISITAYSQEEYRKRSLAAGCEVHLLKPVEAKQLADLLAK